MQKLFLLLIIALITSCYYDNRSEMYPLSGNQNCDTLDVTFSKNMVPLFAANCGTNNSCHSSTLAEGGIILDNYANASQVNSQLLLGSVEHASGFIKMPPTGKLNQCNITQIKIWIENGKPQ